MLIAVFLALDIVAANCALKRYRYRTWIGSFNWEQPDSKELEKLVRAFTAFPQRLEPRVILEMVSSRFLGVSPVYDNRVDSYKKFLGLFVDDENVKKAAIQFDQCETCLADGRRPLSPDIWYVSLLLERTSDETLSINLLENRPEQAPHAATADLLEHLFLVDSLEREMEEGDESALSNIRSEAENESDVWKKYESAIDDLKNIVEMPKLDDDTMLIRSTHFFQEAIDRIGTYYILNCALRNSQADLEKGIDWYLRLLETRDKPRGSGPAGTVWLRKPSKLAAYHGFLYAHGIGTPYNRLLPLFAECKDFAKVFRNRITIPYRETGGKYHTKEGWKQQTIHGLPDVREWVEYMLQKGWRYSDVFNAS
ncbi:MAG: hypothetical protein OXC05_08550 [Halieaceae bacterium]|nr:hypothetical protein [Halieaceae bacterium]